jgi:hypothetical protein
MMASPLRLKLESIAGCRPDWRPREAALDTLLTGIHRLDLSMGGLPRGALTEICGPASSGRTSVVVSLLAQATAANEACALVDASDAFDPHSAACADLSRLLWVRCGGDAERALKATDLIVQGGGFGLVVMDLGDIPPRTARRISLTSWFRLRRAVEHTPTVLVSVGRESQAQNCAALVLELRRLCADWRGAPGCSSRLCGVRVEAARRKPARPSSAQFEVQVCSQPSV